MMTKILRGALALCLLVVVAVLFRVGGAVADTWEATQTFNGGLVYAPPAIVTATTSTPSMAENRYHMNSSSNAILVTLPNTSTTTVPAGQCWKYLLVTAGNAVSFTPAASGQTLDDTQAAYAGMDAVGDSVEICSDGSDYFFQSRYIH
jgi:hypothetical protein